MATGNLRDGGQVCLGVDDDQMAAMQPGLYPAQVAEWMDYDNVADQITKYSDPPAAASRALIALAKSEGSIG